MNYGYDNSNWGDLLTSYGGNPIAYEGQTFNGSAVTGTPLSGNPTSYYNGTRWTFGWAEGRNLVDARGGGHTVSYTYDHNGGRTTKTVNCTAHKRTAGFCFGSLCSMLEKLSLRTSAHTGVAIRSPKCFIFDGSEAKTVRF